MNRVISIDTETTGLDAREDEILSCSICDAITGEKIWHSLYKPVKHKSWDDAQRVNKISPDMVKDCKAFSEDADMLHDLVTGSDLVVVYNAGFDLPFIENGGALRKGDVINVSDPMIDFARVFGEWNEHFHDYKWQKLVTAAEYIGYEWQGSAHDSLADCRASAAVWRWLCNENESNEYREEY